jgi:hypothetical protein
VRRNSRRRGATRPRKEQKRGLDLLRRNAKNLFFRMLEMI